MKSLSVPRPGVVGPDVFQRQVFNQLFRPVHIAGDVPGLFFQHIPSFTGGFYADKYIHGASWFINCILEQTRTNAFNVSKF
jgi:hypothetical protein